MKNIIDEFNDGTPSTYDVIEMAEKCYEYTKGYTLNPDKGIKDNEMQNEDLTSSEITNDIKKDIEKSQRTNYEMYETNETSDAYQKPADCLQENSNEKVYVDTEQQGNKVTIIGLDDSIENYKEDNEEER